MSIANLLDRRSCACPECLVTPQINTEDRPPGGNDWAILVTVFDENDAPRPGLSFWKMTMSLKEMWKRVLGMAGSGTNQMLGETTSLRQ